jgi:4-amino-4-deoxy-L-arabinose transferase-like glycosyltransferase
MRWTEAAAAAGLGLAARLALIAWTAPLELSLDEARFWDLATSGMEGTAFLPPLYPCVLAALRRIVGDQVTAVRVATACLSTVSIVLVHRLAERLLGPGSGRWPALAAALLPALVYYDGRLRSESLAVLLLLGFATLWTAPGTRRPRSTLFGAGLLLGLVALVRPEFLLLPAVLAGIGARRGEGRAALRRAALLLPGIVVCLLPWTIRNHEVLGRWTLVSTNGGYNFWKSFNPQTDGSQVPVTDLPILAAGPDQDQEAIGYREGWAFIRAHPARSLWLAPMKLAHLLGPERDFLSDVRRGRFPRRAPALDLAFGALSSAAWFLLLAGGLFALLGPLRSPVKDAVLAVLINLALVHLVFFGDDRFHVPLAPFLCVALPEAWDGSLRGPRALRLWALFLLAEAAFWIWLLARDHARIAALWGA